MKIVRFFHFFFFLENALGERVILDLVWERLSRSVWTALQFWLEFLSSFIFIF